MKTILRQQIDDIITFANKATVPYEAKVEGIFSRISEMVKEQVADLVGEGEVKDKNPSKLLLVQDGSVDIDALEEDLKDSNLRIVVYRQGSIAPMLLDINADNNL